MTSVRLRYYLDFCHKYHFEPSTRQNVSLFLNKLEEKNQNEQQKKQAAYAISIFYDSYICGIDSKGRLGGQGGDNGSMGVRSQC